MPRIRHSGLFKRCGHAARAWPTCSDPWWFRFHHGGTEHRFSLNKEERKPAGYVMDKEEARKLQNKYRLEIQESKFRKPAADAARSTDVRLTVGDVMKLYLENHVQVPSRKKAGQVVMASLLNRLRAMQLPAANGTVIALEAKPLDDVTGADLDQLHRDWKLKATAARGGCTGPNRALKRLRHFFNWAIKKKHTDHTPFKCAQSHVNTMDFPKEPGRTRRLEGDEEARLLQHATTPLMKVLISAGLETGCRIGELLQLTWADVKADQGALLLPADITKTNEARDIPLTQNLRALLDMRRHAPDGTEHGPTAFVFGNEFGQPVKYWRVNEAWRTTCARAGIRGLHFHDLRRELASTLRESGAPDHIVADVLGHANISTTSRYLKASRAGLKQYVQRFEEHRREVAEHQKKATQTQQRTKGVGIRTSFAHAPAAGPENAAVARAENPSKLLN
jgi:integrase